MIDGISWICAQDEDVIMSPVNDRQSKAIKQRASDLRRMLQQRLGPVIFERWATVAFSIQLLAACMAGCNWDLMGLACSRACLNLESGRQPSKQA